MAARSGHELVGTECGEAQAQQGKRGREQPVHDGVLRNWSGHRWLRTERTTEITGVNANKWGSSCTTTDTQTYTANKVTNLKVKGKLFNTKVNLVSGFDLVDYVYCTAIFSNFLWELN